MFVCAAQCSFFVLLLILNLLLHNFASHIITWSQISLTLCNLYACSQQTDNPSCCLWLSVRIGFLPWTWLHISVQCAQIADNDNSCHTFIPIDGSSLCKWMLSFVSLSQNFFLFNTAVCYSSVYINLFFTGGQPTKRIWTRARSRKDHRCYRFQWGTYVPYEVVSSVMRVQKMDEGSVIWIR